MDDASRYLLEDVRSEKAVAQELGIGRGTLADLRKRGCPYLFIGRKVYFLQQDLVAWLRQNENRGGK